MAYLIGRSYTSGNLGKPAHDLAPPRVELPAPHEARKDSSLATTQTKARLSYRTRRSHESPPESHVAEREFPFRQSTVAVVSQPGTSAEPANSSAAVPLTDACSGGEVQVSRIELDRERGALRGVAASFSRNHPQRACTSLSPRCQSGFDSGFDSSCRRAPTRSRNAGNSFPCSCGARLQRPA